MEVLSFFAPIAFVFAIAALSQAAALRKDVQRLSEEVERLKRAPNSENATEG
ncbi:MAG: hypothetical protein NUW23_14325 [Firmicutes bacterium]|jgi:histidinol-phosphate/aromatic aminotransferase/cobyric acid decarboxylase-like protein|nr:hypothetical protein [Bacillota bacterium]